jgi:hypothetical protein
VAAGGGVVRGGGSGGHVGRTEAPFSQAPQAGGGRGSRGARDSYAFWGRQARPRVNQRKTGNRMREEGF